MACASRGTRTGEVMEVVVAHQLGLEQAVMRFERLAERHGIELEGREQAADGWRARAAKSLGFLGAVRAQCAIDAARVRVEVESAPAALGASMLAGMLERELRATFGASAETAG